ncbi:MAG: hypothetical protein VX929_03295 [Pseudomonadota bacterium]|nr:hypothetical protein [Pseudomonadota bacterium]
MIKALLGSIGAVVVCLIMLLIGEGANAILSWKQYDASFTYKIYRMIKTALRELPTLKGGPAHTRLLSREHLEPLIPRLMALDAGLGNSPFGELETPASAVNQRDGDCLVQKLNLRKTMTYLRTNIFNPFDPPALFYDSDRTLGEEVEALVRDYGTRSVSFTTNSYGERTTLPHVASDRVVLIAGDSVANGTLVDDSETLSSQMQARDPSRRHVNLGVGNADPADIMCALKKAVSRYGSYIDALIYVYCENDFIPTQPYGDPDAVVDWLESFTETAGIDDVTVVYAPYIYNVVPQFTRFRGYHGEHAETFFAEQARLRQRVRQAGFRYLDIGDVALQEIARRKTQFAAFSLFIDHVHLSPYSIDQVADALTDN